MNINSSTDSSSSSQIIHSWAERNGFADWAIALIWLVLAFVLFQVVAGFVFVGLMAITGEMSSLTDLESVMMDRLDLLFIGNTTGQIVFLGLATFVITRLHLKGDSSLSFLRITWSEDTLLYIGAGALLIVCVQPIVLYLGYFNSLIPVPESVSQLQISQYEMIEQFLRTEGIMLFALFNIALVPAICEEVLFRGYVMRAFENSWGIIKAVIVSGLVFGMFHLQLHNLLPLATLGIALALMTWLSGSIWPAVAAHLINNGGAVLLATSYPELAFGDMTRETLPPLWLLLLSILLTALIVRYMMTQSKVTS
jgi:membrane protease YdiL (CAAX protease family)